jgi:hypothetical protein
MADAAPRAGDLEVARLRDKAAHGQRYVAKLRCELVEAEIFEVGSPEATRYCSSGGKARTACAPSSRRCETGGRGAGVRRATPPEPTSDRRARAPSSGGRHRRRALRRSARDAKFLHRAARVVALLRDFPRAVGCRDTEDHPTTRAAAKGGMSLLRAAARAALHAATRLLAHPALPTPRRCRASGPSPTATRLGFGSRAAQASIGAPTLPASRAIVPSLRMRRFLALTGQVKRVDSAAGGQRSAEAQTRCVFGKAVAAAHAVRPRFARLR